LAQTLTLGAGGGGTYTGGGGGGGGGAPGGGGGGGGGASTPSSSDNGSEQPLTSTCLPPIDPHTAPACGVATTPAPPHSSSAANTVAQRLVAIRSWCARAARVEAGFDENVTRRRASGCW
jgi:hypothetical protein